jgi:oligopeptide transport system substrate-binding protein
VLRLFLPIILLIAALVVAVAADPPAPRADFTFINRGDVSTLDPHRMSWMQDLRVAGALFEGLVEQDNFSSSYDPRPAVAERWEVSQDGRTYTFHLRSNPPARWSNGDEVVSTDFRRTWRRATLPDTVGDYIDLFRLIDGVAEFYTWREEALAAYRARPAGERTDEAAAELWKQTVARFDTVPGISTPDPRTLVVRLVRPVPYFLDLCGFEPFAPLHMDTVERFDRLDPDTGRMVQEWGWTKPGVIVGNGPFVLSSWRFKREMRLERNPHYWHAKSIAVDSMAMPSINDPNATVLAFRAGGIDWLTDVVPDYKRDLLAQKRAFYTENAAAYNALVAQGLDPVAIDRRLPKDPRQNIHAFPAFGTYFYNFNCSPELPDGRSNPFADARVRRAFALCADKPRIAQIRGIGEPTASSLIPSGSLGGYTPPAGLPRDPEEARRLFAAAGYAVPGGTGGKPFITVEILLSKDGGHELIAQSLARDWQQELGVRVVLNVKEVKVFSDDVKNNRFMLCRAGWFGDFGDPTTFLDLSRTGNGNNDRRYSNPAYDALLAESDNEPDAEKRLRLLERAERMLMEEELPMMPLVHYAQVYMFDPHRVSGITPHPRQKQQLARIDILGDGKGPDRPLELPPRSPNASPRSAAPAPALSR